MFDERQKDRVNPQFVTTETDLAVYFFNLN